MRDVLASFRARLVLLVLVAVLPALALLVRSAAEQRRQATVQARQSAARLVQLAGADHERIVSETRHLLAVLARVPAVMDADPSSCSAFLSEVQEQLADRYTGLAVAEPDGKAPCVSIPSRAPLVVSDRVYFERAMRTRGFAVGEFAVGRITGEPILGMAQPLLDETGGVRKVIVATLSLRWLRDFAAEAELPSGAGLMLQDGRGTVLALHPHREDLVGRSMPESPLFRAMDEGTDGTVDAVGIDGVERIYAFLRLRSSPEVGGVYLGIGIPRAEFLDEIDRTLERNLTLLGLATGLALLAAWVGGDLFFLRKVKALVAATERVQQGDLSARTGVTGGRGELEHLAVTFDRTAGVLQERTEALQRREQEARAALAARDEVLRVVAHDLRNPLTSIGMFAALLESELPPEHPSRARLDTIERTVQQMDRLIQDLLDVSRVEAGTLKLDPRPAPPVELVAETIELMRLAADRKNIALLARVPPELPAVLADRDGVRRVLSNLLDNALKFTPAGGRIVVDAKADPRHVSFSVHDTGPGIAAEDLPHLFDHFWQAQGAARTGSGLGLTIAKGIVEAHGGRIWVRSAPDSGSTFAFTLPRAPPAGGTVSE